MSRKKARNSEPNGNFAAAFKPIVPKNLAQEHYLNAIHHSDIVIGTGPAGTGKTYISTSYAAEQLYYKKISKLILTRPNIEAGESIGFLPGTLDDKYAPYLYPFLETLEEKLGKSFVEYLLKTKVIEPIPIGFLRGRTFNNAVVILDEAQNATKTQMKLILSRIGNNTKMIIEGDTNQLDIPKSESGLEDASKRLINIPGVQIVNFTKEDIVRSKLCKRIVEAYEK